MKNGRPRGRPRAFDRDQALETALELFWRQGYEGTSVADLTAALGIKPPSLYAAFGSKEGLYREALERYLAGHGSFVRTALTSDLTAREAITRMLREACAVYAGRGCMVTSGALVCAPENAAISEQLALVRFRGRSAIVARLDRAVTEGDLPPDTDTAGLGAYYAAVIQGLSVQARDGTSPVDLQAIATLAMAAWPVPNKAVTVTLPGA